MPLLVDVSPAGKHCVCCADRVNRAHRAKYVNRATHVSRAKRLTAAPNRANYANRANRINLPQPQQSHATCKDSRSEDPLNMSHHVMKGDCWSDNNM